jgi:hypothetical protein
VPGIHQIALNFFIHFNEINWLRSRRCFVRLAGKGGGSLHLVVFAKVAELVDALDLGSSAYGVGVRVPPFAPEILGCMTAKTSVIVVYAAGRNDKEMVQALGLRAFWL